ncbi:hypothetical protein SAMN05444266_103227 [Chitinophaga jiangningensis]|uniref:Uncharacterized protein n=1 Tax=Chitinophaga jiangningensis TaxID=1419482 RepID=A0A1M7ACS0_9BACT|nr:hypothetical protein [Chitinophaga jiangningensis]SHL40490.1 hypothetical protein SAMN05444266_103227 [Chitinophaga jiangningensis]
MKKYLIGAACILGIFSACEKEVAPVDGNYATVTLNGGEKAVTGDLAVNPGDSITFDFTINTQRVMKYVGIQKNPVNQTGFVVRDTLKAQQTSYSALKKIMVDTINGTYLYRIVAHDSVGTYIGSKDITITVNPDFYYYTVRMLRVPDTTAKTNTCYMAATTGEVFSYTTGAANSAKIDFGLMYDTTGTASASTTDDLKFCLYALSAPQGQIPFYDLTSWTKNNTIMKKATSPAFNKLLSGGDLRAAAKTNLASGTSNKITQLASGNLVFFKTASGKTGCLSVNYANGSSPAISSYINVDVKIER